MREYRGDLPDAGTEKSPLKNRAWEAILPDEPGELEDFALTVRQTRGRRAEADTYQCQVARDANPLVVRLLSVTDPAQPDVYEVAVGVSVRHCTCRGFSSHRRCKHVDAVADMVKRGVFAFWWAALGGRAMG